MTATPKDVIYSALTRDSGFRRWATTVYAPKTAAAERLVRTIRNDPRFPEGLEDRETLQNELREEVKASAAYWLEKRREAAGRPVPESVTA